MALGLCRLFLENTNTNTNSNNLLPQQTGRRVTIQQDNGTYIAYHINSLLVGEIIRRRVRGGHGGINSISDVDLQ